MSSVRGSTITDKFSFIQDLCWRVCPSRGQGTRNTSKPAASRKHWAHDESLRRSVRRFYPRVDASGLLGLHNYRTDCFMFVVETLLDVIIGSNWRLDHRLSVYYHMPVPCSRDLWETNSTEAWTTRYRGSWSHGKDDDILTIGDVCSVLVPTPGQAGQERSAVSKTTAWCQGLDQYGQMVWMAISIGNW
jgi:hypothetical protein